MKVKSRKGIFLPINLPSCSITPIDIWGAAWEIVYAFEESEEVIRMSGLVPDWMPYPGNGVRACVRRNEPHFVKLSRLKNNRLRLWISSELVLAADQGFRGFMGVLMSDTRLSLVKGESA